MSATPRNDSKPSALRDVSWLAVAFLPGLLHPVLGLAGAALAAAKAPRWRPLFIAIAVAWLGLVLWSASALFRPDTVHFGPG